MKKGKNHVVIISPFARPNLGGVESHIEKLIRYANKKNFYVTLLTYFPLTNCDPAEPFEKGKNYEIYRCKWFGNNWFPVLENYYPLVLLYLFPGLFVECVSYFLKNGTSVDSIHAHGLVAATITRIINIFAKKRSVVSTHAVYTFKKKPLLSFVIKQILLGFDTVLAVSEVSKQELVEMGISNVKVHPNWVETDVFKPLDPLEKEKIKKKYGIKYKTNFLFVGRFIERKGIKLILEAAQDLKDFGFHLVGTGPLDEEVVKAVEESENIFYYGKLMQHVPAEFEKLLNLYNTCDFFLSPYLYDEGFSATLIEALSCGTPVIVSNRGSPPTFLDKSVAVFLSSMPTAQELVKVLPRLKENNRSEMSTKCRNYAIDHFGYKNADVIIDSYNTSEEKDLLERILRKVGDLNFRRRVIKMLEYLDIQRGDKVLDMGCGEGFYSMIFDRLYDCEVTAVDYDSEILKGAKKWLKGSEKVTLKKGDICNLKLPDNYFDKIVCTEVLEHIGDDKKAVSELYRVLKPGGRLAVTVPNKNYPLVWDPLNKIRESLGLGHFSSYSGLWGGIWAYDHKRLYTPDELKKLLKSGGFFVSTLEVLTHYGVPFNHLVLYLGKQFYTRLPVSDEIKSTMEKFDWESDSEEKVGKSLLSRFINFGFSIISWIDHFNDRDFNLSTSSMAVAVLAVKEKNEKNSISV